MSVKWLCTKQKCLNRYYTQQWKQIFVNSAKQMQNKNTQKKS